MNEVEFYLKDLASRFKHLDKSKYYLSYSGGKDSHFLYWFIKEYLHDDEIEIVGVNTYMEHPEILKRILNNCDKVLIPKLKPFEVKKEYGIPCFTKNQDEFIKRYQNGSRSYNTMKYVMGEEPSRFNLNKTAKKYLLSGKAHKISPKCCEFLKKKPLKEYEKISKRKPIMGVRGTESGTRKAQYKSCFTKDGKFTPLYDLPDDLLDKIYEIYNIEIPQVYQFINRTGCMGCPYGKHIELELSLINNNQKKFITEYFKESYEVLGINLEVNE